MTDSARSLGAERPQDADLGVVLTPMIDIVFQLLVFFLLTLRFKTVDERIQSELPKRYGEQVTPEFIEPDPAVRVRLTRSLAAQGDEDATQVRLGRAFAVDLPFAAGPRRDAAYGRLVARLGEARAALGDVRKGEIETPDPGGALVPHGDIVCVLDALLESGIEDVAFEGRLPPLVVAGQGGVIER